MSVLPVALRIYINTRKVECSVELKEIALQFLPEMRFLAAQPFGSGNINKTYRVDYQVNGEPRRLILQCINTTVFKNPHEMMINIHNVTEHIKRKVQQAGGDPRRESLSILPTADDQLSYTDAEGNVWRAYACIDGLVSYNEIEEPILIYNTGKAFGRFLRQLEDYPAETLFETIPNFHHTPTRFQAFCEVVEKDPKGRAAEAARDIEFVKSREAVCNLITDRIADGSVPLRVTHNDTKLNNVLVDPETKIGVCVIDLDTVMNGSMLYDFGDMVRSGAVTASEEEADLSKVHFCPETFGEYAKGYLSEAAVVMTPMEIALMGEAGKVIALELGMRFLMDYLNGDVYFRTEASRPLHNLERARNQFKLVADIEEMKPQLDAIIEEFLRSGK